MGVTLASDSLVKLVDTDHRRREGKSEVASTPSYMGLLAKVSMLLIEYRVSHIRRNHKSRHV